MKNYVKRLDHVCLYPTPELYDRVVEFYHSCFGMETVHSWEHDGAAGCMLSCGNGAVLEIMALGGPDNLTRTGAFDHMALYVDEIEEVTEKVRAFEGTKILVEPMELTMDCFEGPYPIAFSTVLGVMGEKFYIIKEL